MEAAQEQLGGGHAALALAALLKAKLACWDALASKALLLALSPGENLVGAKLDPEEIDRLLENIFRGLALSVAAGDGQAVAERQAPEKPLVCREVQAATNEEGLAAAEVERLKWAEGTGLARVAASLNVEALLLTISCRTRPRVGKLRSGWKREKFGSFRTLIKKKSSSSGSAILPAWKL
ncbi:MAG: hypothetical protein HYU36_13685 [Planctomycetes bacterium]|nr:hypothetical protein [Planctomycetota bacterium]